MNEFDKIMSERSDFELFEILNHKRSNYKPEAIDSAEREFKRRNISSESVSEFEQKAILSRGAKEQKAKQKTELKEKAENILSLFLPIVKDSLSKTIRSLCIFLSVVYLYYFVSDFRLIMNIISDPGSWDLSIVDYFLPFLLFPIGIYGLWKTKKYGWYITHLFLTFYIFSTVFLGMNSYKIAFSSSGRLTQMLSDFIPQLSILDLLLRIIIPGGLVIFLNRKKVLELYKIKRLTGLLLILVILVINTLIWWPFL